MLRVHGTHSLSLFHPVPCVPVLRRNVVAYFFVVSTHTGGCTVFLRLGWWWYEIIVVHHAATDGEENTRISYDTLHARTYIENIKRSTRKHEVCMHARTYTHQTFVYIHTCIYMHAHTILLPFKLQPECCTWHNNMSTLYTTVTTYCSCTWHRGMYYYFNLTLKI